MQKKLSLTFFAVILISVASGLFAVDITSIAVQDSLNTSRTTFSSTERINLVVKTSNSSAAEKIKFTFKIKNPLGAAVFTHTGNSIPGSLGNGGSSLKNISITSFYRDPGNYTLEITATPASGSAVTSSKAFAIYSPLIILSYPANGAIDLVDQPLILRWVASGASKYRVYVDDDQAFYNAVLTEETIDTSFTYPQSPPDPTQKLISGQVYYWKVEGLDAVGNKVASSQVPFSFTIKQEATSTTRDIAILSIKLGIGSPPRIPIDIEIKNAGGRIESNITLTLFISGMVYGKEKIAVINAGEIKTVTIEVEPQGIAPGQPLFVSVTHDLYDDNVQNNILSESFKLTDDFFKNKLAKVLGRVTALSVVSGEPKGIVDAKVTYSGPKAGALMTEEGGRYKIENLPLGTYKLKVSHPIHKPQEKEVMLEESKAYPNIDFKLERKESAEYTIDEIWQIFQESLSAEILTELDGYELLEIKGAKTAELYGLTSQLKEGKAKILKANISY